VTVPDGIAAPAVPVGATVAVSWIDPPQMLVAGALSVVVVGAWLNVTASGVLVLAW
jgi:hypothetical protein